MPHPAESVAARFEAFLRRLTASGVAAHSELMGCSDDEIGRLEAKCRLTLPTSYRLFLRTMGHRSGRLFTHDHIEANFADVLRLTEEQVAYWKELPEDKPRVALPADALVILSRLDEQWLFIRCTGGDDAPVLYYNESGDGPREWHASVLDWLETWRDEAEEAIGSGYYEHYPDGKW